MTISGWITFFIIAGLIGIVIIPLGWLNGDGVGAFIGTIITFILVILLYFGMHWYYTNTA